MPQLNFAYYLSQFFWLFVSFCSTYVLCSFVILPTIKKIINNRINFIKNNLEYANNLIKQSEEIQSEINLLFNNAKLENMKNINDVKNKLSIEKQKKIAELSKKLSIQKEEFSLKLNENLEIASENLRSQSLILAQEILNKAFNHFDVKSEDLNFLADNLNFKSNCYANIRV